MTKTPYEQLDDMRRERDEQATELSRLTVERAKLMNDNDALRTLLKEARDDIEQWLDRVSIPSDPPDKLLGRIDAALAQGEKL